MVSPGWRLKRRGRAKAWIRAAALGAATVTAVAASSSRPDDAPAAVVAAPPAAPLGGLPCAADCGDGNGIVDVVDLLALLAQWGAAGACDADGSGVVDIADLLDLLASWGPCAGPDPGACALPDCTCVVATESDCVAAGGIRFLPGADCTDADGDRLPDAFERNDCSPLAGCILGTDPGNPDTDGDGLLDGDEAHGTEAGLDLPGLGADPFVPDVFLEIDWFDDNLVFEHSHRPTDEAVTLVVEAFAHAPTTGPCGATGIALHVDYGQGGAFTGGNLIPGGDTVVFWDSEFNAYKAAHFAPNRNGIFHYAIYCHRFNSPSNNSSGIAELPGDDFIVSLQTFISVANVSRITMHELGHNLFLRHGGFENRNYKPNYNSVMNYRFLFPGIDVDCDAEGDGVLDYSSGAAATLDETALLEPAGVCGNVGIDWNGNGGIDPLPLGRNINCEAGCSTVCNGGGCASCGDTQCTALLDHDDWGLLDLVTGLGNSDGASGEVVTCQVVPGGAGR